MEVRAKCDIGIVKKGRRYKVLYTNPDAYQICDAASDTSNAGGWYHKDWFVVVPSLWVRLGNFLTHNH